MKRQENSGLVVKDKVSNSGKGRKALECGSIFHVGQYGLGQNLVNYILIPSIFYLTVRY